MSEWRERRCSRLRAPLVVAFALIIGGNLSAHFRRISGEDIGLWEMEVTRRCHSKTHFDGSGRSLHSAWL